MGTLAPAGTLLAAALAVACRPGSSAKTRRSMLPMRRAAATKSPSRLLAPPLFRQVLPKACLPGSCHRGNATSMWSNMPIDDGLGQWPVGVRKGAASPGYTGVNDVGGVESLLAGQPLDLADKSYSLWERQTHALVVLLIGTGNLGVDELRRCLEELHPVHYASWGYYEKWAAAAAKAVLERGVVSAEELDRALGGGEADAQSEPRFAEGDVVRVRQEELASRWRKPHLRTPGYIFGLKGVVERYCGTFQDPEFLAFRGRGKELPLYRIRFCQKAVWPDYDGSDNDTVDVEVYQSWLESTTTPPRQNTQQCEIACDSPKENSSRIPKRRTLRITARTLMQDMHDFGLSPGLEHRSVDGSRDASQLCDGQDSDSEAGQGSHGYGHSHSHSHGEGEAHEHLPRGEVEQTAVDREGQEAPGQRVAEALVRVLIDKGVITSEGLRKTIEAVDSVGSQAEGPRLVARAWLDPEFKQLLLADATAAAAKLGIKATNSTASTVLTVVESTDQVHNLVVCTLCSCYPLSILGLSPPWYKSREYRARAVREPRRLLREAFDLELPEEVTIQVHDSTADLRYLVLPRRPAGTEGWSEEELQAIVTRDTMIGVAVPKLPS
ncbi:unnamed protein product [Polarella glacialis]|uniref:nitrile hydratase n=1 Tax=Polarella glacialis TaxID=89957 RepID=A0A813GZP9_POLGL|nr:unnamed protein product [Polarella glacialis]